jgi:hypothetical protein
MSAQPEDGTARTIERWRSGLGGPQLDSQPEQLMTAGANEQPAVRYDGPEPDQYDDDFDYYWGDWKIPLWIALIWQVPWRQRLDIFVIGFIVGLVIAGVAVSWGLLLSRY